MFNMLEIRYLHIKIYLKDNSFYFFVSMLLNNCVSMRNLNVNFHSISHLNQVNFKRGERD